MKKPFVSQRKMALGTRELRPCKEALKKPKEMSYGKRVWALSGKVPAGGEWGLQGDQEGLVMQSCLESLSNSSFYHGIIPPAHSRRL